MRRRVSGFTYIALLLAIALFTAGLAKIGEVWHTTVQRSKEAELVFIGEQFRSAIKLYYDSSPGGDKQLPRSLEDLLRDRRYPVVRRYLRKVYLDPMRGTTQWGLIKRGEGIVGVHSLSDGAPFRSRSVDAGAPQRMTYADLKFVADIALPPQQSDTGKAASQIPDATQLPPQGNAPAPNTPPPIVAVPTEAPKPRPKPPTDPCERLRINDARACGASASRLGRTDAACEQSAATRYAHCTAGAPAGPLWMEQ